MPNLIVTVEEGKIQGRAQTDLKGNPFLAFYGIPYAKPPLGELRFKDPLPPEPWTGLRDCTQEGTCCYAMQFVMGFTDVKVEEMGSEDCLILNVYTRGRVDKEPLKPVMFWIHGGAFTIGSGGTDLAGAEFLMTQDVVLVTINYRLGALGFLSIKDQQIGNAGLKDMVQALKWVRKNITQFGGDPNCVTIFGESAGGAAVQYLVLSPLAKSLFHRAIAQSGCVINPWARGRDQNGIALARALGCTDTDSHKVLKFLQDLPISKLIEGQMTFKNNLDAGTLRYFSPTIEDKSESAFLCEDPVELVRSGRYNQVPYMTGCVSQEGLIALFSAKLQPEDPSPTEFVPFVLGHEPNGTDYKETNRKICKFYFDCDTVDENNKLGFFNVIADTLFLRGVCVTAKNITDTSSRPVYLYRMSAETGLNRFKNLLQTKEPGACHVDDIGYLFKTSATPEIVPGSDEDVTMQKFLKLWTNFARCGNPTPDLDPQLDNVLWRPLDVKKMNFLDINTTLKHESNIVAERMKFWDELLSSVPGY